MNREQLHQELVKMLAELPIKLQEKFQSDKSSEKLIELLLDRKIFDIIHNLQESQSFTEKDLFIERQRLVEKAKEQETELIRKHTEVEKRCADRPQHFNLLQTANKRELEAFTRRSTDDQQRFDMKIVLDLDQKLLEQQTTLEKAGVPYMYATNKPQDVRLQMFIIEFIQRIAKKYQITSKRDYSS